MTTLIAGAAQAPENLWSTMPGWGIVVDLTPPELTDARRLKVLRKIIAILLVGLIVPCAMAFALASFRRSSASDDLAAAHQRTTQLAAQRNGYHAVTALQATTAQISGQIATLMTTDVDVANLLSRMDKVLPGSMQFTSVNVTMNAPGNTAAATGSTGTPVTSPDTTTHAVIGTVTLSGSSRSIGDVVHYVASLIDLRGVINVVPNTNSAGDAGSGSWTITLQLTDELYTHRYTATSTVGGTR